LHSNARGARTIIVLLSGRGAGVVVGAAQCSGMIFSQISKKIKAARQQMAQKTLPYSAW